MAEYPGGVYSPRTKENKPGITYDEASTKICFAEDVVFLDDEVVAIETELGLDPKGSSTDLAERIKGIKSLDDADADVIIIKGSNVGIGTATPTSPLEIQGTNDYGLDLSSGAWTNGAINFDQPFQLFSGGIRAIYFDDANSIAVFGMGDAGNIDLITSATNCLAIGSKSLRALTSGFNNTAIGTLALHGVTSGHSNIAIGTSTAITTGSLNIAIGSLALNNLSNNLRNVAIGVSAIKFSNGADNVAIGNDAGFGVLGNNYDRATLIGSSAGRSLTTGDDNIFIGYKAGYNQTDTDDLLIIDNQDRGSAANELTKSLIYGVFDADPANQSIRINGEINCLDKSKMTAIGGFAIKLTNNTGANTTQGQTVVADPDNNDAFILCAGADDGDNADIALGIILESGIADEAEAWVVVSGIADVAFEDNVATTRGFWVGASTDENGYADIVDHPKNAPDHMREIGHCIESVAAGGEGSHILARCVLHFN